MLQADPRSVYRKESCVGQVYPFFVDALDVRVEFADQDCQVTICARRGKEECMEGALGEHR